MPPVTAATPIQFSDPLPKKTDILIIGGGVIGVSTALSLAEAGHAVTLCEKGRIAGEQSSRNWGWIRQLGRDPAETPLAMEAIRMWHGMAERVGADVGFRAEGVTYLCEKQDGLAELETYADTAAHHQIRLERLDRGAVDGMIDGKKGFWAGGLRCPSDGRAEPWIAVPAMARALQKLGGVVRENCAVRALEIEGGHVVGAVSEYGPVRADAVMIAGGAWTSLFLERHGVFFPQLSVRATAARIAPAPDIHTGAAVDEEFAFRRREDGGYTIAFGDQMDVYPGPSALRFAKLYRKSLTRSLRHMTPHLGAPRGYPDAWTTPRSWRADEISPFERQRILEPRPTKNAEARLRRLMRARLPALAEAPVTDLWAGMIDALPDTVPTLDAVPDLPGLWVASGFSGHGFGIGPAAGRIMADLIRGRAPGHDLTRFRFNRFTDGSPIRPGPGL